MKLISTLFFLGVIACLVALNVFAQAPAAAVVAPAAPTGLAAIAAFVSSHVADIALAVYGVLDVLVLLSPKIAANGIVHLLLSWAASKAGVQLPGSSQG